MHKKLKDTDYLGISTRVRAMENRLLTRERMERMIEARTSEEAAKVLTECGYGELSNVTASGLDEVLAQARDAVYKDMRSSVPDHNLIDVFQMKYDYHNAKVLLKAEAMGLEESRLLSSGGRALSLVYTGRFQPGQVLGRSVVLHALPDDYRSQPTGAAGSRIACGVISPVA